MATVTTTELERLEREVTLLAINKHLAELRTLGMSRSEWLDYLFRTVYPEYFKPPAARPATGVYRAQPAKVAPLRTAPYEVKQRNLQEGEPGYEAQQREYERQWLAARRQNGYEY